MFDRLYDIARLNFTIFPGIDAPRCADFLRDYYEFYASQRGHMFRTRNAAFWQAFRQYVPRRARSVARRWHKDEAWIARATDWGRRHFCDPRDIATFEIVSESAFRTYQRRFEQVFVVRAIEGAATDHAADLIDKTRFQTHCEALQLPVPRTIGIIADGTADFRERVALGIDVIVKPARGSGGAGIKTGVLRSESDLHELLGAGPRGRWIVQERCRVHPALADLALDALPTARIITLQDELGAPEIVSCAIRLATVRGVPVDNVHRGGLGAAIDVETGALGRAKSMDSPGCFTRHPATDAVIMGRVVPDWPQARNLALCAHRQGYRDHVMIGWDIGFSDRGPVLIEGNQRPNVRLTQRTAGTGIGAMRYGALIEHHLRCRIEANVCTNTRFLNRP